MVVGGDAAEANVAVGKKAFFTQNTANLGIGTKNNHNIVFQVKVTKNQSIARCLSN
jgi:hypothetical protein